jgi:hypothetical protein
MKLVWLVKAAMWGVAGVLVASALPANAIEIKVSAKALERTLDTQLFKADGQRFYIRGNDKSPCFVYAAEPKVSFKDDRIVIHVKTNAKLGGTLHGACLGVSMRPEADVSVIPEAVGETIGFRDARVENLSTSKELSFLLVPFLSRKLPQEMKIDAAGLIRQLLAKSAEVTGYAVALDHLKIHSMQVQGDALVVDFDGDLSVE